MLWIRNLIYWVLLAILTTSVFLMLFLTAPLPRVWRHRLGLCWPWSLLWLLKHVIGLDYEVIGAENIPETPAVICSKHQSGWETLALQKVFPIQVYVSKRELLWIPFFGWGLYLMNTIAINRSDPKGANAQIMKQGKQRVDKGFWISIFPEGTRIKPGVRGRYKNGAARLAKTLDIPLVPVAHNAGEFWPRNSFLKYPGKITLVIGPPVMPAADDAPDALMHQVEDWIEARQREIGGVGPFADPTERAARQSSEQTHSPALNGH